MQSLSVGSGAMIVRTYGTRESASLLLALLATFSVSPADFFSILFLAVVFTGANTSESTHVLFNKMDCSRTRRTPCWEGYKVVPFTPWTHYYSVESGVEVIKWQCSIPRQACCTRGCGNDFSRSRLTCLWSYHSPTLSFSRSSLLYVSTSILSPSAGSSCTLTYLVMGSFLMIFSFSTAVVPMGNL